MFWEYVYIGSDIVRSILIGLCLTWPTSTSKSSPQNLKTAFWLNTRRRKRHSKKTSNSKNNPPRKSCKSQQAGNLGTLLALEPRIMFDGAALATGAEVVQDQVTQDLAIEDLTEIDAEAKTFSDPFTDRIDLLATLSSTTAPSDRNEIIFIDTSVEDYQTLLLGIDPSAEAILLDSTRDGMEQIAEILGDRSRIDAIHIISHGDSGELRLGTGVLNLASMQGEYTDELATINRALTEEADFLVYGCNFGEGESGQEAAALLAALTGADLAASDDLTGTEALGGDWDLEVQTGLIESTIIVNEQAQRNWAGLLATFNVTNTNDSGAGSLRQAIIDANSTAGIDTINLPAGTYTLTGAAGEDAAATGDLDITDDVIIVGAGAATTILDGNSNDRIFHIRNSATATISAVTIQDGVPTGSGGAGVRLENSTTLSLSDSILTNNDGTGGDGGAFHVHGTLNLNRVLLSNNLADKGAGIYYHGADGGTLTNVTISGNTGTGNGGGLWTDTAITVKNSTITLNQGNNGGGIFASGATVTISNTIVSDNTATSSNNDVQGTFSSDGSNLIETVGGASGFVGGDLTGASANLVGLASNGGPTQTHALLGGNLAINAGTSIGAPAVDQRGFIRDGTPDIGAFEFGSVVNAAPTLDLDANDDSGATGNDYQFTFTEGAGATAIADTDTNLVDADSTTFAYVKLAISGLLDGNAETLVLDGSTFALGTAVAGQDTTSYHVVIGTGAGTATMTISKRGGGTFSEIETETLITAILYQHTDTSTPTNGDRLIDVIVNDGTTDSAAARTTINVNPVNDVPVATGNTVVAQEDVPLVIDSTEFNFTDVEGDSLVSVTITGLTLNGGTLTHSAGAVTVTNGMTVTLAQLADLTFTSALNDSTNSSFTYTVNDAGLGVTSSTMNITVNAVNDQPVNTVPGAQVVAEDTALGISGLSVIDLDGNLSKVQLGVTQGTVAVTLSGGATISAGGSGTNTLTISGTETDINATLASLSYQGNPNYNGPDTLTMTSTDGNSATDVDMVGITVTGVNDAPSITSDGGGANASVSVLTGNTTVTTVNAIDVENAPLTYSIIGGVDASLFTIDPSTGALTFTTAPNVHTPSDVGGDNVYDVIVQVSDGTATDTQSITVTVTDVPFVVLPPPPDPSTESPPPSEDGDRDAKETEDEALGGGLATGAHSASNFSAGDQGSTAKESKDSNLLSNPTNSDLAIIQQLRENRGMGGNASDLWDLSEQSFNGLTVKNEIQSLLNTSGFLRDLDHVRDAFEGAAATEKTYVASSIAASTGLSIGYVFWLLRSGVLLTALLSAVPAWQFVNPLLVLDSPSKKKLKKNQEEEEDSVESMFEKQAGPTELSGTNTDRTSQIP